MDPNSIAPTIGQNSKSISLFLQHKKRALVIDMNPPPIVGRITLSSSVLQFWDLGGQKDIRSIWPKYYSDCHAVVFVIDSTDKERIEECWAVFG